MMALESASTTAASASKAFTDAQVVVLRVQGGDYAVPINRVQEIVPVPEITRVPHAQSGVEGVINLRGRVLPVVDLAARLALGTTEHARSARTGRRIDLRCEPSLAPLDTPVRARQVWGLDATHAHTFRAWEALGSPEEPTPARSPDCARPAARRCRCRHCKHRSRYHQAKD